MIIRVKLTRKQQELNRSLDTFDITGYGGAKGGGKSHGLRSVLLLRSLTRKGHVGALFRRTYPELEENHIGPLFRDFPVLRDYYNSGRREIRIPELNSELKFRFCERQADVDRYAGREYHTLGIEEAGDWPTEMAFRLMRNCNRSTVPGIKASTSFTFNWGGIGHGGLKRIFVTKDLRENEKNLTFNFILAKVEDNPAILEHDPGYLLRLESEPNEALRRAYRHGDPDIIAGQYFDLRRETHVVKPFPIPVHWTWFGSYDYGFNHPAVWLIFTVSDDGVVYLVREFVKAKQSLKEQAAQVSDFLRLKEGTLEKNSNQIYFHAGHDCWAKKKADAPTIAEDFLDENVVGRENLIYLERAKIDRQLGAHRVRQFLHYSKDLPPRFFIFDTCQSTIECLTRMVHDPNKLEDVLKQDSVDSDPSTGDDQYDAVRYGLMSRPSLEPYTAPPPKSGSQEWMRKQEDDMEKAAYKLALNPEENELEYNDEPAY